MSCSRFLASSRLARASTLACSMACRMLWVLGSMIRPRPPRASMAVRLTPPPMTSRMPWR